MQLKRFTDLGIRVLYYLTDKADRPIAIAEIADALQWNKNHVIKVARFMVRQGWIIAVRGRTGGLMLAHAADWYRLGDVARVLEGECPLIDCHTPPCPFLGVCGVLEPLAKAQAAFFEQLNRLTLADAVGSVAMKERILKITEDTLARQNEAQRNGC